jgi:Membrane bound O-acyl transferase family
MESLDLYLYILLNYVIELFVLGFVPARSRTIRCLATIIHTIVCFVIHQKSNHTTSELYDVFIGMGYGSLSALKMLCCFLLYPKAYLGKDTSFLSRIKYTNSIIWNPRMVGHPERVKNVPEWRSGRKPTKLRFLGYKALWFAIAYILADALTSNVTSNEAREQVLLLCAEENEWLFRVPTIEEFKIRLIMTVIFWIMACISVNLLLQAQEFMLVALGMMDVENCRPQFGSFVESYSIRNFWGLSWHQNLRHTVTIYSDLLAGLVPIKNRLFQRYFKIIIAFGISGFLHEIAHVYITGHSFHLTTVFFMLCGVGIMMEDLVQHLYKSIVRKGSTGPSWYERLIGYCWVVLFYTWATPLWSFSPSRDSTGFYLPVRFINSQM